MEENENVEVQNQGGKNATEAKGFSITAMILGIISLVICCVVYISIPCAILAIIFGIIGRKKGGKGMGTAGLVLGIITLAVLVIAFLAGASFLGGLGSALEEAAKNVNISDY